VCEIVFRGAKRNTKNAKNSFCVMKGVFEVGNEVFCVVVTTTTITISNTLPINSLLFFVVSVGNKKLLPPLFPP
jgi:hypothetical protein